MTSPITQFVKGYKPPRKGCIKCDRSLTINDSEGKRYELIGFFAVDGSGPFCKTCRRIHNWNFIYPDVSYEQHMREVNRDPKNMLKPLREILKRK